MKKILIGLAAGTAAIATPALAGDGEGYVGVGAGIVIPKDTEIDIGS